jgi:hypothetical protein
MDICALMQEKTETINSVQGLELFFTSQDPKIYPEHCRYTNLLVT